MSQTKVIILSVWGNRPEFTGKYCLENIRHCIIALKIESRDKSSRSRTDSEVFVVIFCHYWRKNRKINFFSNYNHRSNSYRHSSEKTHIASSSSSPEHCSESIVYRVQQYFRSTSFPRLSCLRIGNDCSPVDLWNTVYVPG